MTSSPEPPSTADERFHLLVDGVIDYAIYMLDPAGRVTSWNAGAERIKGYQESEVLGKNFSMFYPPEAIAAGRPEAGLRQAASEGRYQEEQWRVRKDGTRFWANVVITALRDASGHLRGFAKVTRDATARKQMEDELRQTKESLAATLYSIGDGVIATDVNGLVVRLNPVAERLTGWPELEARGKPITTVFNIVNEQTRRLVENPVDRVLREGLVVGLGNHTALISRDGTEYPIADSGAPIRGGDGAIAGSVLVFRDVTDERRAERSLRESEERFRLLVNSVEGYAIFMLDTQGRVVSWNAGAARVKGYTSDEIVGRHISVFYPPEDTQEGKPFRALQIAASKGQYEEEGWRLRKDGSRFWANVVLTALHDEAGNLHGFAKITRDFSQRRANEETTRRLLAEVAARRSIEEAQIQLQESEERYRSQSEQLAVILQGIADGVTVHDGAGRILYANDAAARTCGLASAQDLLDIPASQLFSRFELIDDANGPFPIDQLPGRRALAGEDSPRAIVGFRDMATGVERWSLVRANALKDASGRPALAVNIWHDISEERRHHQEARFLSEASAILAASLDYPTTLERVAQLAVPRLADWCAVDVLENDKLVSVAVAHVDVKKVELAKRLQERYPPDPNAASGAAQVARSGTPELYPEIPEDMLVRSARDDEHLRLIRQLGLRSAIVVPLVAAGRPLGTISLISAESNRRFGPTDLATAEELGRRAGMAIDNSRHFRDAQDAIRVRDDFVSIAGHELKTPLAALQLQTGGVERLLEKDDGPDLVRVRERLVKIGNHSRRLERLIHELLDVSRITSGRLRLELEETDLTGLVSEVVARFNEEGALQGAPIRLDATMPVRGRWDRLRLDQVITNLISNAIKYGRKNPIDLTVSRNDGTAVVRVRDYGIGIDAAAQARIFERFERAVAGRNYGGFGLGLWIARQIVEAHHGRIRVESAPELGATFTVELPCA